MTEPTDREVYACETDHPYLVPAVVVVHVERSESIANATALCGACVAALVLTFALPDPDGEGPEREAIVVRPVDLWTPDDLRLAHAP